MIETIDFSALIAIGLSPAMQAQLACGVANPQDRPMRLMAVQRDHWLLHDGHQPHRAQLSATLQRELQAQGEALAVGDWVLARPLAPAGCSIHCRLLPSSRILRRTRAGGRAHDNRASSQRQVLVSNVDTALLVMGLDHDFQLRRLERYLALVQLAGVEAVLVLSKADLVPPDLLARRLAAAAALLPSPASALALDLRQPSVARALAPWLQPGRTLVLLGSSGAGKSTLANSLLAAHSGAAAQHTGAARLDDSRGRHTTTVRQLLPLPGAACLIDTPGLRALRLDLDDADVLGKAFSDVARLAPLCRFRNCRHLQEPGCAVREAVDGARLNNYRKLLREARHDRLSPQERGAQLAAMKVRARAARARVRAATDEPQ